MKTAVIYYSMLGNSEYAAWKVADALHADVIKIEPVKAYPDSGAKKFIWGGKSAVMGEEPALKPYEFNASDYDRIILGFPVWASTFAPPIKTFIKENKEALSGKRIAAFTCMAGNGGEKALDKLCKFIGIDSLEAQVVLIDPKDKQTTDSENAIANFIDKLRTTL